MIDTPSSPVPLSESIPIHYFNGFSIAYATSDFSLTFKLDNRETFLFKGSYTIMKTLAIKISESVAQFEKIVGQSMLTNEEVVKAFVRAGLVQVESETSK